MLHKVGKCAFMLLGADGEIQNDLLYGNETPRYHELGLFG